MKVPGEPPAEEQLRAPTRAGARGNLGCRTLVSNPWAPHSSQHGRGTQGLPSRGIISEGFLVLAHLWLCTISAWLGARAAPSTWHPGGCWHPQNPPQPRGYEHPWGPWSCNLHPLSSSALAPWSWALHSTAAPGAAPGWATAAKHVPHRAPAAASPRWPRGWAGHGQGVQQEAELGHGARVLRCQCHTVPGCPQCREWRHGGGVSDRGTRVSPAQGMMPRRG